MNSIFGIVALVLAGILAYFKPKETNSGDIVNQSKPLKQSPSTIISEWVCIPFIQFGPFKKDFTELDILQIVGQEHLYRIEFPLDEEHTQYSSVLFGDTSEELIIDWDTSAPYKRIEKIRVNHENSRWRTFEGIKVGSSLEELEAINKKPFRFYGLEWEKSGLVSNWNDGVIREGIFVNLAANNPEEALPVLVGEAYFDSNQKEATLADMEVVSMEIRMN